MLGLNDEGLVAGECKFTSSPVGEDELADLERTTDGVRWSGEPTDASTRYVLLSRSGFTGDLQSTASRRSDVSLFGLGDILGATGAG